MRALARRADFPMRLKTYDFRQQLSKAGAGKLSDPADSVLSA